VEKRRNKLRKLLFLYKLQAMETIGHEGVPSFPRGIHLYMVITGNDDL